MKTLQSTTAILSLMLLLTDPLAAQQASNVGPTLENEGGFLSRLTSNYRYRELPPIDLRNSQRLEQLMRAGRIYLSLQDAIALALENNLDIAVQRYTPMLAQTELLRAEAGGLLRGVPTNISQGASSAVSSAGGGVQNIGTLNAGRGTGGTDTVSTGGAVFSQSGAIIPQYDPVLFTQYTWGQRTSIQSNSFNAGIPATVVRSSSPVFGVQKAWATGTTVQMGFNNSHIQTNVPRAEINPFTTSSLSLQVQQRLLQGFGIAVNTRNIRVARNEIKISDLTFRQQLIATISSIINLYWDLVSINEDVKVKRKALELAEKLLSDNRKQVEIGTLAPIEIIRAEAEVARTQQDVTISETQLLQQETIIKNALSRTGVSSPALADARIVPTDSIRMPDVEEIRPIQDLVELALANRPDIAQTKLQIDSAKIGLAGSKSQLLPSLDLIASAQNNGLAGDINSVPIPGVTPGAPIVRVANPTFLGGYGSVLSQLFRHNYPDYSIGFQLSIPLYNRQARADVQNDLIRLRQTEMRQQQQVNQVRVDVQNALIAVQQARARYQSALKSRVFAEQALDAEQKKYALGASTIFFVIQAQRDLSVAQGAEVAALSNYQHARVSLDQATGETLRLNNVSIEEAYRGEVSRGPSTVPLPNNGK